MSIVIGSTSSQIINESVAKSNKVDDSTQAATEVNAVRKTDFDSVTERLKISQKQELLQKIEQLQNKEAILAKVVDLANSKSYSDFRELFLDPEFEYFALAALKENRLSAMQFGTLMFARSALSEQVKLEDFQVVRLFDKDAPQTSAWDYIKSTLQSPTKKYPAMTDAELTQFFERMRAFPESEQAFVIIPDTISDWASQFDVKTSNITRAVNDSGFNVFGRIKNNNQNLRMVPSFGMVQALLDVTGPDKFTFKIIIGESTSENIRLTNLDEDAREICVHSQIFSPGAKIADDYGAPPLDFTYHDIFHTWHCKHIPQKLRRFLNESAGLIHSENGKYTDEPAKKRVKLVYDYMVDMLTDSYGPENGRVDNCVKALNDICGEILQDKNPNKQEEEFLSKVQGLCALWVRQGGNFSSFAQLHQAYEALDPEVKRNLGPAFFRYYKYIKDADLTPASLIQELVSIKVPELLQLVTLPRETYRVSDLVALKVPLKTLLSMDSSRQKLIFKKYAEVTFYLQNDGKLETLLSASLDELQSIIRSCKKRKREYSLPFFSSKLLNDSEDDE